MYLVYWVSCITTIKVAGSHTLRPEISNQLNSPLYLKVMSKDESIYIAAKLADNKLSTDQNFSTKSNHFLPRLASQHKATRDAA